MTKAVLDPTLQSLDMRSRDIFRRIVDSYLRDGEPVGSRSLSRMLPSSLSPATVRNVMSDLEHLGLVYAPHISAGRLPTQKGLRFFVDAFMELGDLSERGAPRHRGAGQGVGQRRDAGADADRGQPVAVGHVARRRPRAHRQQRGGAEAYRVHPARADQGAGRAGVAERRRREPGRRPAGRHHRLAAARGLELPQRPHTRPHARRGEGRDRPRQGRDQGSARHAVAGSGGKGPRRLGRHRKRAAVAAHRARPRQSARKRHRPGRHRAAAGICSRIWRPRTG